MNRENKIRPGVAIDVGTTTIALELIDLDTGNTLAQRGDINAQARFGADVTSRIDYCARYGHGELTDAIRRQIDTLVLEALAEVNLRGCAQETQAAQPGTEIQEAQITQIAIAANTVMQHLIAGYSPVSLGTAPYSPVSLFGEILPVWDTLPAGKVSGIYYTPCISSYVGGDITAGLLAAGFEDIETPALFIDIGTNGEIVLKHKGIYYCCATAAGPAFESKAAAGICGSQLIDILADMLKTGAVDESGRLIDAGKSFATGNCAVLSAADVRALQLAKAAIAGGIQVLLFYAGIDETDIGLLALAGGFGSAINPENAARIGLFPKTLLTNAIACGNTSLKGAATVLLSPENAARLDVIRGNCQYIDLSSNAFFNDKFVENMAFFKYLFTN